MSDAENEYVYLEILHQGPRSTIWKVKDTISQNIYAMKITHVDYLQIDILARLKHENLITMLKYWIKDNNLYILMDIGSVSTHVITFNIIKNILSGVWFLHENGCVHGNISMSNIIFINDTPKLIDFASSDYHPKRNYSRYIGPYKSPENKNNNRLSNDLWALGILLLKLLVGSYDYKKIKTLPENFRLLINLLLEYDPILRISNRTIISLQWKLSTKDAKFKIPHLSPLKCNTVLINFTSEFMIEIMAKFNLEAETVFLAMDIYYRLVCLFKSDNKRNNIALVCIYLASEITTSRGEKNVQLINWLTENIKQDKLHKLCYLVLSTLNSILYIPNILTSIHDPADLKNRAKSLFRYEDYINYHHNLHSHIQNFHNDCNIRIPFNLLL